MTPEQRAAKSKALSEGGKRSWADPEIRDRRIAGMLRHWDDPLNYVLHAQALEASRPRALWLLALHKRNMSPEEKAKWRQGCREGALRRWAREREKTNACP